MTASLDDATWYKVLLAVRWPAAVVASSAVLGGVLLYVLSRPIPIRLAMPLEQPLAVKAEVEQLNGPLKVEEDDGTINIKIQEPVPVSGTVGVNSRTPIPITGEPKVVVTSPVEVRAKAALPVAGKVDVKAAQPLPVQGEVDVTAGAPFPVKGDVRVEAPKPLQVETDVTLDTHDNPVQIQVKGGMTGIF